MDLKQAIYARRAVREFTEEAVDEATLVELVDAAIQAPSATNQQSWQFSIIHDRKMLAGISVECKKHMLASSPLGLLSHHLTGLLVKPEFNIFYDAPALIVISYRADSRWATEDCALAAQNLMLTAHGLGLGTCWIGFAQPWLSTGPGKSLLELSAEYSPVAPIIVGHPKKVPQPVLRKKPEIHWIGKTRVSV
jgi:nitroreductase